MPTYEYQCSKCGVSFDFFQSMSSEPLSVCPKDKCAKPKWGRGKVKRVMGTGAGLIFKGSGFYITDYRSEGYKQSAKNDVAPAASSTTEKAASTTSTESKPAAKPAAPASTPVASKSSKKAAAK